VLLISRVGDAPSTRDVRAIVSRLAQLRSWRTGLGVFARASGDRLRATAASRGRWPSSGWSVSGWSPPSPRCARCP